MSKNSQARRQERHTASQAQAETQTIEAKDVGGVPASIIEGDAMTSEEQNTLQIAPVYKYEPRQSRAKEAKVDYDPNWAKRAVKFLPGVAPKGDKSVMAILYKMVVSKPGIVGSDLATMLRYNRFANHKRSKYLTGDTGAAAIPAVGWAEGYIDGAVTKGFLKMEREPAKTEAKTAETKTDEASKATPEA